MSQEYQLIKLHSSAEVCKEGPRKTSDVPTDSSTNEISTVPFIEETKTHNATPLNLPLSLSSIEPPVEASPAPTKAVCFESPCVSPRKKMAPNDFSLLELVGMGAYSKVALVEQVATGKKFAMKVMEKKFLVRV